LKKTKYNYELKELEPKNYFYACDGSVFKNLIDLANALRKMKVKTFKYHVNREKNDFSKWVRHCIKDKKLADNLARLVMKDKIEIQVLRRIIQKSE